MLAVVGAPGTRNNRRASFEANRRLRMNANEFLSVVFLDPDIDIQSRRDGDVDPRARQVEPAGCLLLWHVPTFNSAATA